MKVQQIMTASPLTCTPDATLADIALLMWEGGCGFMPVVDSDGAVQGVITDRDICLAAGTRRRPAGHIHARDLIAMERHVACCHPDDDVRTALALMQQRRVRRLPVTGPGGVVTGVLSMDDILLEAGGPAADITADDVVNTMKTICSQHLPVARKTEDA